MPGPVSTFGRTALNTLLGGSLLAAGTAGMSAVIQAVAKKYNDMQADKRFQQMLMVSPELAQDPRARLAFNTFNRLHPHLAGDPLVASTFVRQVLATDLGGGPAVDPNVAANLYKSHAASSSTAKASVDALVKGLSGAMGKSIALERPPRGGLPAPGPEVGPDTDNG